MWTKEQSNAISAPVGNILVSAAAGSGKTAVMVERIIERIVGDNPVDVDRMLIVTYTNAAAAEIKERVMNEIIKKLDEGENDLLRRQLVLMNNASICTIHSFCLDVVRNNFNALGIDPDVKIGNVNDIEIYKQKAIDAVMDSHYNSDDADFLRLVRAYSAKNDSYVADLVKKLYEFSASIPDSEKWLCDLIITPDTAREKFLPVIFDRAKELCKEACAGYERIMKLCRLDDYLIGFLDFFASEAEPVSAACQATNWNEMFAALSRTEFNRLVIKKDKADPHIAELVKAIRGDCKDTVKEIMTSLVNDEEKKAVHDIIAQNAYTEKLSQLALETSEMYTSIKREKSVMDFSDFEHLCLKALRGDSGRSDAAMAITEKYDEIYIDEYQDCNSIQEEIFSLISGENIGKPNVFCVGDMKQSIYRFRDANPKLIKKKSDEYAEYNENVYQPYSKIILNKNFRSRSEILSSVNSIFRQLMTEGAGELDYTPEQYLYCGADCYESNPGNIPLTEIAIIDSERDKSDFESSETNTDTESTEDYGKLRSEAVYIAGKIKEMISDKDFMVYDKGLKGYRHIEYRDIVVLMKSVNPNSPSFTEVFDAAGIPVFTDVKGYFDSKEIVFLLNFMSVIDNPVDDIPLVAVMRHPVIGFDDNELMEIRLYAPSSDYYTALTAASHSETELGKKCASFLENLDELYEYSRYMSVNELLFEIIQRTGYMTYLSSLANAETAKSNVKMLFYKANEFEGNNFRGIFNFVNYIDMIKNKGGDTDSAKTIGENDNVVRIMTIHKSKGLEFPVVFLAKCSTLFNRRDLYKKVLMHRDFGIGMNIVDVQRRISYPTLAKEAIKICSERELISEELRVLYVALTRARERLIITSYVKNAAGMVERICRTVRNEGDVISPDKVIAARSYIEWILMGIVRNTTCKIGSADRTIDDGSMFDCQIIPEDKLFLSSDNPQSDEQLFSDKYPDKRVYDVMSYVYPYSIMTKLPRNISVTELKRMSEDDDGDFAMLYRSSALSKPKFISERVVSASELGTLVHLVLEKLDFKRAADGGTAVQIDELVERGIISEDEKSCIDAKKLDDFVASPLGCDIISNLNTFSREFSFKYMVNAREIYGEDAQDDDIIVQGVVDAFFIKSDGTITLIDYKTDRIISTPAETAEKYRSQIEYYTKALEKILGRKVTSRYIYLFEAGEYIKM